MEHVECIMRLLTLSGFVEEAGPREYLPTIPQEMNNRNSIGVVESM